MPLKSGKELARETIVSGVPSRSISYTRKLKSYLLWSLVTVDERYPERLVVLVASLAGTRESAKKDFAEFVTDVPSTRLLIIRLPFEYLAEYGKEVPVITGRAQV